MPSVVTTNPLNPEEYSDIDFAAELLATKLGQAVQQEDQLFRLHYDRILATNPLPGTLPKVFYRETPVMFWCQKDPVYTSYIDCWAQITEGDRKISGRFARYFVLPVDEKEEAPAPMPSTGLEGIRFGNELISMPQPQPPTHESLLLREHYDKLKAGLDMYSVGGNPESRRCLRDMFEVTAASNARRVFSPFHPDDSKFDLQIMRIDGTTGKLKAILAPIIVHKSRNGAHWTTNSLDSNEVVDVLEVLFTEAPEIAFRLLSNPIEGLPKSCLIGPKGMSILPTVPPKVSNESRRNLPGHLADVLQALREIHYKRYATWTVVKSVSNRKGIHEDMAVEIMNALEEIKLMGDQAELYDLSHPLTFLSGDLKSPRTRSLMGLSLFQRVICKKGLWIAIRGQNRAESQLNTGKILPLMTTTKEFEDFAILDNPLLAFHKLHIQKDSRGIFVVVIWEAGEAEPEGPLITFKTVGPPQMPPLVADYQKGRLVEDYPVSGQSTSTPSRIGQPPPPAPSNPVIQSVYPSLDALMSGSLDERPKRTANPPRITIPCVQYSPSSSSPVSSSSHHTKDGKTSAGHTGSPVPNAHHHHGHHHHRQHHQKTSGAKERISEYPATILPNPLPGQMTQMPLTSHHLMPVLEPISCSSSYPSTQTALDPNSNPIEIISLSPPSLSRPPQRLEHPVSANTMRVIPSQGIYPQQLVDVSQTPFGLDYPGMSLQQASQMAESRPVLSHPFTCQSNPTRPTKPEPREESYPCPSPGYPPQQRSSNTLKPKTSSSSRDDLVDRINALHVPCNPVHQSPVSTESAQRDKESTSGRPKMESQ